MVWTSVFDARRGQDAGRFGLRMRSNLCRVALPLLMSLCAAGPAHAGADKVTVPLIAEGKPDAADSSVTGYLFRPSGPARVGRHGSGRPQVPRSWSALHGNHRSR